MVCHPLLVYPSRLQQHLCLHTDYLSIIWKIKTFWFYHFVGKTNWCDCVYRKTSNVNRECVPEFSGKQIGRIKSVMGTLSFNRNIAMSLSKLVKLNCWAIARRTNLVSGRDESLHLSCSPNVTFIMNHMKLQNMDIIYQAILDRRSGSIWLTNPLTQWAAVTTYLSLMSIPPQ